MVQEAFDAARFAVCRGENAPYHPHMCQPLLLHLSSRGEVLWTAYPLLFPSCHSEDHPGAGLGLGLEFSSEPQAGLPTRRQTCRKTTWGYGKGLRSLGFGLGIAVALDTLSCMFKSCQNQSVILGIVRSKGSIQAEARPGEGPHPGHTLHGIYPPPLHAAHHAWHIPPPA